MISANLTVAIIGLVAATIMLYLVRRDHLHVRYALWWIPTALIIAVLSLFPRMVDWIGASLGIRYPPILAVLLGLVLVVVKLLLMDIEQSRLAVKLDRLVQRLALLEERMEKAHHREDAS